jgi:hypothetical protein
VCVDAIGAAIPCTHVSIACSDRQGDFCHAIRQLTTAIYLSELCTSNDKTNFPSDIQDTRRDINLLTIVMSISSISKLRNGEYPVVHVAALSPTPRRLDKRCNKCRKRRKRKREQRGKGSAFYGTQQEVQYTRGDQMHLSEAFRAIVVLPAETSANVSLAIVTGRPKPSRKNCMVLRPCDAYISQLSGPYHDQGLQEERVLPCDPHISFLFCNVSRESIHGYMTASESRERIRGVKKHFMDKTSSHTLAYLG